MDRELLSLVLVSGASLLNIALTFYLSNRRIKPEIEKMHADRTESYAEAGESLMAGAQISSTLLLQRIDELKEERDNWRAYARVLRHQIKALNADPIPFDTGELKPKKEKHAD